MGNGWELMRAEAPPLPPGQDPSKQDCAFLPTGVAHRAEGARVLGTLMPLLGAAGHGTPILTGPVEVVG